MTNFNVDNEEAYFLDWRLHVVQPDGELSEEYKTIRELFDEGYSVKYETSESVFMLNPYFGTTEGFIIDKKPLEEIDEVE